jgi:hypothetical protein
MPILRVYQVFLCKAFLVPQSSEADLASRQYNFNESFIYLQYFLTIIKMTPMQEACIVS